MSRRLVHGLFIGTLTGVAGIGGASAQVSSELQALRVASEETILQRRDLTVLTRRPGPGNEAAFDEAVDAMQRLGLSVAQPAFPTTRGEDLFLASGDCYLHVTSDGRRIRFSTSFASRSRVAEARRLDYDEAMQIAAAVLTSELAALVPLAANERLVPLGQTDGKLTVGTPGGTIVRDEVIENVVRLGRTIDGVLVLGPGSRAVVRLDGEGRVLGVDVDWSEYLPTDSTQQTLSKAEMLARLAALEQVGALPRQRQLRHVECGLFDPGATAGGLLQPGCVYHHVLVENGSVSGTFDIAVPAGASFVADESWHESTLLRH